MKKTKYLERPFKVKADSIKSDGTFTGHASVFGELDSYRDIVMPGAFNKSLQEDFAAKDRSVPMLWQHDTWSPIGIYSSIKEDDIGLYVEGACNMDVQQGREAHALMKQGALSGLSIGYTTVISEWNEKELSRKLFEVNLWEVSPVTFPAGDLARVSSVKSIEGLMSISECEETLRDAGFSKKEAVVLISRIKAMPTQGDPADDAEAKAVNAALQILRNQGKQS